MKFIVSKLFRLHSYKRLFTKVLSPFIPFKQIDNPVVYMTLYVKDEEDIIESNIKFHMSLGIDGILVTDNGSTDSTMEILKKYQEKGWIKEIIVNTSTTHPQAICVDKMIHIAKEKYHADWVINVDADEFWWTPLRNLQKAIGNYPHNNIIYVPLKNMVPEEGLTWIEWSNVVLNSIENYEVEGLSKYSLYRSPIPKVIHRTQFYQIISRGNHQVQMLFEASVLSKDIMIYHYPIRGNKHFENKTIRGGEAYLHNPNKTQGVHWRFWYSLYQKGALINEFSRVIGIDKISDFKKRGIIGTDIRFLKYLRVVCNNSK